MRFRAGPVRVKKRDYPPLLNLRSDEYIKSDIQTGGIHGILLCDKNSFMILPAGGIFKKMEELEKLYLYSF